MIAPGALVVCVGDFRAHLRAIYGDESLPTTGRIYTVREVIPRPFPYPNDFLRLVEVVNEPREYRFVGRSEIAFRVDQFRPLDETRLAVFRKALAPVTVRQFQPDLTPT